ncbi:polysaccharide deacetylase [Paenibacillus macerans]|uniref:polysaccharide deacetylase n=1 Tax=Paenibacillus macerans TaxID=44252 RepID=UPI003D319060
MAQRKRNTALNVRRKNRRKRIRVILQAAILLVLGTVLYHAVFDVKQYVEPDKAAWSQKQGFIALSYFGVGRNGTAKLVAKRQLDKQLEALHDQGYRTISQQDIIDFYEKGAPLPDRALFLSFEDGRNDSSLFAEPLLEKYNYKATFLSYADKMGNSERKFVQPKDMLKMAKTGFWELGTNGYRLSYINIFDKDGRFIGMKDEKELTDKANVAYYNHYLMDFIRDENMIPVENRTQMEARIDSDYTAMKDVYSNALGYIPSVYMIMHANELGEGMNPLVTAANTANIKGLFKLHFNREGSAYNTIDSGVYDLTRVQPEPYWSTNHLLMKIRKDTGQSVEFVRGDKEAAGAWERLGGAAEFAGNKIVLTSPSGGIGKLSLKGDFRDVKIAATAAGNVVGKQSIYLRYDRENESYVRLTLENNVVTVEQKGPGRLPEILYKQELPPVSWKEEELAFDKASVYTREQTAAGAASEKTEIPVNIRDSRRLEAVLQGNELKLAVDGQVLLDRRRLDNSIGSGKVALAAQFSEQSEKDDIYDAVFENVEIASLDAEDGSPAVQFSNRPSGWEGIVRQARQAFDEAVNWAIDHF